MRTLQRIFGASSHSLRVSLQATEADGPCDGLPVTDIPTRAQEVAAIHSASVNPHSQVRRCCWEQQEIALGG
jgi:hypothetical protein